jgi:hypothetical protein
MTNVDAVHNKHSGEQVFWIRKILKKTVNTETVHHIFTERKEDYINILRHPEKYRNAILQT